MRGRSKMSVFVHAQGIKTVHAGGWGQKWQNSVHVVVEWPLKSSQFLLVLGLKPPQKTQAVWLTL